MCFFPLFLGFFFVVGAAEGEGGEEEKRGLNSENTEAQETKEEEKEEEKEEGEDRVGRFYGWMLAWAQLKTNGPFRLTGIQQAGQAEEEEERRNPSSNIGKTK